MLKEKPLKMRATPDAEFGHYKIISPLGAGGMGEVYLALDTRLERKVALKILQEKFSCNGEGLSRFRKEAKASSALNHPNIITIYDVGESGGVNFIAAEFIDGKTLRKRMSEDRISFDEVLSISIQTAEALSAAHQAGIVHRDIKPENIMIRPDGYVKVLDFGLAKLTEEITGEDDETRKLVKTTPGMVMGTGAYMSPEQARGKQVDARSDIFSFGVVLYEVLAGCVPFSGETIMDVITAVIKSEPSSLSSIAPHLPKELQRIVHKTLKKTPEQRYQTTRDLLNDLKDLRDEMHLESKLEQTAVSVISGRNEIRSSGFASSSGGGIKDALLLTEFENTTGESVFDQTLKTALAFSLAQSPFLDILPETKARETLKLMGRSPDEQITKSLGEEICLRRNLKAYITGAISTFGNIYVLTLEAINAGTGESLGREFEQVNSREEILNALGRAAAGLREKLGESLSSIESFCLPGDHVTTSSLEALKMYSLGRVQMSKGKHLEAVPFYKKALEIDQDFMNAYTGLAVSYANAKRVEQATEMIVKAYALRDHGSELEKLRVTYFYYKYVTGEIEKAIEALELWAITYPSDVIPQINLSDCYEAIGQSEKAVAVASEVLWLGDDQSAVYSNLADSLMSLDRYQEVKEICRRGFEKKYDGDIFHLILYKAAFVENDAAAMAENLNWFAGRHDEYLALDLQTGAAAFGGKWRKAQDFARRTVDLAVRLDANELAAKFAADQALRIVFWSSGTGLPRKGDHQLKTVLKTLTNKALILARSKEVVLRAALALAVAGESAEAAALTDEIHKARPKDTLLSELWLPMIRAALHLHEGKAKEAIEELEIAERFEKGAEFYPQYLRGLVYLHLKKTGDAVREFEKILDHRGEAPLSSIYPLAQLGKARATKDKKQYEMFFELWKDADQDMPALVDARKEISK